MKNPFILTFLLNAILVTAIVHGEDWPVWGKDGTRNMVSTETGLTLEFDPGKMLEDEAVDMKTTQNVKWVAKLGSQAYGNVTIGEGKVWLEPTTNQFVTPRNRETAEW